LVLVVAGTQDLNSRALLGRSDRQHTRNLDKPDLKSRDLRIGCLQTIPALQDNCDGQSPRQSPRAVTTGSDDGQ